MDNPVRKVIKQSRNKFLATITESLAKLEKDHAHLEAKIDAIHGMQQGSINELREKIKNSGTVLLSKTEVVTKIFSGIKIYLDPRDISVTPHLALDYIWEDTITYAWLKVIRPGDTVLDIGANFGYFGALAAQYGGRESKVVFFEPNPNLIPYIEKTLSVNWLKQQSTVENLAVTDKKGTAKLNILKDYIGSSSLIASKEINDYMHDKMSVQTEETVSVSTVTIDDYCQQHDIKELHLIKMDIEGYEDKAYAGMRSVVAASPRATLFVEFTRGVYDNPKKFYEQMLNDFGHVYVIDEHGDLTKPKKTDYQSVIGAADDWVMPVFSKDSKLADR